MEEEHDTDKEEAELAGLGVGWDTGDQMQELNSDLVSMWTVALLTNSELEKDLKSDEFGFRQVYCTQCLKQSNLQQSGRPGESHLCRMEIQLHDNQCHWMKLLKPPLTHEEIDQREFNSGKFIHWKCG